MGWTVFIMLMPFLFIISMTLFARWADPDYSPEGSFFETFAVNCPVCQQDSRFNKDRLIKKAAADPDSVRRSISCQHCRADIVASFLTTPFVKGVLLRADTNVKNNALYQEFVKQVQELRKEEG